MEDDCQDVKCKQIKYRYPVLFLIITILISLIWSCWLVTYGTWNFIPKSREINGRFYDLQADGLLQGKLDVPCDRLFDRMIVDGKCYLYFGITPSLIRVPLNFLFPDMKYRWSRILSFISYALIISFSLLLFFNIHQSYSLVDDRTYYGAGIFTLILSFGSSLTLLISKSYIYHESILWGVSLVLISLFSMTRYLSSSKNFYLILAILFTFLSLHSRSSIGIQSFTYIFSSLIFILVAKHLAAKNYPDRYNVKSTINSFLPLPPPRYENKQVGAALLLLLMALFSYCLIQYGKFGTLDMLPYKKYHEYYQIWLNEGMGELFSYKNVWSNINFYFNPSNVTFSNSFPYVKTLIDVKLGVASGMPGLLILSCIGLVMVGTESKYRKIRLLVISALVSLPILLSFYFTMYRYVNDMLPSIIILSAVASTRFIPLINKNRLILCAAIILVGFQFFINSATAISFQRSNISGAVAVPIDAVEQLADWREKFDINMTDFEYNSYQNPSMDKVFNLASHGDTNSMCILGTAYLTGEGVIPDIAESLRWYRKAARANNAYAQEMLGNLYSAKCFNFEPDFKKANEWYQMCAPARDNCREYFMAPTSQ